MATPQNKLAGLFDAPTAPRPTPRAPRPSGDISHLFDAPAKPRRSPAVAAATPAAVQSVDPRLDSFVNDVIGEASRRTGYTYKLGEGFRTPEQQAGKVSRGVSWTYDSPHMHGRGRDVLAFDASGNYLTDGRTPHTRRSAMSITRSRLLHPCPSSGELSEMADR